MRRSRFGYFSGGSLSEPSVDLVMSGNCADRAVAGWVNRRQQDVIDYLVEENRVLREHIGPRRIRLTDAQRRRLASKGRVVGRKALADIAGIVTPATILRWYRELVARKYDGSSRRTAGRPKTAAEIEQLVVEMVVENPTWGYTTLRNALANIGITIDRTTVSRILCERGIEPAPERRKRVPWKKFLAAHWDGLMAADFITSEVVTARGLVRHTVFFVIELKSRRVEIAGITSSPNERWMLQMARNLTDAVEGFSLCKMHLILDRDPLYKAQFRDTLHGAGVTPLRLPARSPNLNAFAERLILSIKSECLNKLVILGQAHLRTVVKSYVEYYHEERNHQGLANELITRRLLAGLLFIAPGFVVVAFTARTVTLFSGLFLMAFGSALVIPCTSALVSRYAPPTQQGLALGLFRSVGALSRALGPIIGGTLYWRFGASTPYFVSASFLLLPVLLAFGLPPIPPHEELAVPE